MSSLNLLELWYKALHAEIGIKVQTNDPARARSELYKVRKETGDPKLDELSIFSSPTLGNELWITHKTVELPTEADNLREALKDV